MKKRYLSVSKQLAILGLCLNFFSVTPAHARLYSRAYTGSIDVVPTQLPTGESYTKGLDPNNPIVRSGSTMTVHQNQPQAVIHWQGFDVGKEATVLFDQQDQSWKVMNRVMGDSYSQILGSLTAKGQVYLLNQNGILFGPDSQINVHSLVASSLNMKEEDYLHLDKAKKLANKDADGEYRYVEFPKFYAAGREYYSHDDPSIAQATVANYGTINVAEGGNLFLIGSNAENHGKLNAPGGQVALVSGETVSLHQFKDVGDANSITKDPKGALYVDAIGGENNTALNTGSMTADRGLAGMYGSFVNQEGLIRSITALSTNGNIELKASKDVTTSKNSITATPVITNTERSITDGFKQGKIDIEATEGSIVHQGTIIAPGGEVTLSARDRIYLENDSTIDVSGSWVGLSGNDRVIEVTLNTKELRDSFLYKDGPLLGEKIQVDTITGLSVADISENLTSQPQSALERSVNGGTIKLKGIDTNSAQEVIVKENALLDFGGGGIIYGAGLIEDQMVRVGNRIYSLNEVPKGAKIDEILGTTSREHERWGITQEWSGNQLRNAAAYKRYLPSFTQGGDAGTLEIWSRKVILDGSLNGAAVRGIYQDMLEDLVDDNGYLAAVGRRVPFSGTLTIGKNSSSTSGSNYFTDDIVIQETVAATDISSDEALSDWDAPIRTSSLSASKLNDAGLGTIELYANTQVTLQEDADIVLSGYSLDKTNDKIIGGSFYAEAKGIEHYGTISAPGGNVSLTVGTPISIASELWQVAPRQIFLGQHSIIDVSGAQLNNSTSSGNKEPLWGLTQGGTIKLFDLNEKSTKGIILTQGSQVDVSGGYELTDTNTVLGNDAGSLSITGSSIVLDGSLSGHALQNSNGGTITLHADNVSVSKTKTVLASGSSAEDALPQEMQNNLTLAENQLQGTGFSTIALLSENNLVVEKGIQLTPSYTHLKISEIQLAATTGQQPTSPFLEIDPLYAGETQLLLSAGKTRGTYNRNLDTGFLKVEEETSMTVAPQGKITLTSANDMDVAAQLSAPGGTVVLQSEEDLTFTGLIDASGILLPDYKSTLTGLPLNHTSLAGGNVKMAGRNITLTENAVVDVSGSALAHNTYANSKGGLIDITEASAPGSVTVTYQNEFIRLGELRAKGQQEGLTGGTLSIKKDNQGYDANNPLTLVNQELNYYLAQGFDALSFSSPSPIKFDDAINIIVGRSLTLNTPELVGTDHTISISAPWIRLLNVDEETEHRVVYSDSSMPAGGNAFLTLAGDVIDIAGDIGLNGFDTSTFSAKNEIRLYETYNNLQSNRGWNGALRGENITMQSPVIYPANFYGTTEINGHDIRATDFVIHANKKFTTLAGETDRQQAVYSAGGSLTVKAEDIEHRGELAAPLGTLSLEAINRVLLADGSKLNTQGETTVLFGSLQSENWQYAPEDILESLDGAPTKKISINGEEIIQAPGAEINVGGGGSIFSYEFLPGYEGTNNPLAKDGRFVILADNSVKLPGEAVYLEGIPGLPSGLYSKLPDEFAFQPGAMIIETTGSSMLPGQNTAISSEGYTVVAGYETVSGTALYSSSRQGYIVRKASEVLSNEGKFDIRQSIAGDAGQVEIHGTTTILGGLDSIYASALPGFKGASLGLSAAAIEVAAGFSTLLSGLNLNDFNFEISTELRGKMPLDSALLQNKGLEKLVLGDEEITQSITLLADTVLNNVPQLLFVANRNNGEITLEKGVQITAAGTTDGTQGEIILQAKKVKAEEDTLLYASDLLRFDIDDLNIYSFKADIEMDHGRLEFSGEKIYLEPQNYTGSREDTGVYLTSGLLEKINSIDSIDSVLLDSASDIVFLGAVNLNVRQDLTLDAARFTVDNNLTTDPTWGPPMAYPYTVNISAGQTLRLQNSNAVSAGDDSFNGNKINLAAENIIFGSGDILLDTFNEINFTSTGETIFNGTGSLTADLASGDTLSFKASKYLSAMTVETLVEDGKKVLNFALSDYLLKSSREEIPTGEILMAGNGATSSSLVAMPGSLQIQGQKITLENAFFDMPGGILDFTASQSITVQGSTVQAKGGTYDFPIEIGGEEYANEINLSGGLIAMRAGDGGITIDSSSLLDTSAATGQGGTIAFESQQSGIQLDGTIKGSALAIDTLSIDDFGTLARTIKKGGFEEEISLRARQKDITVNYADTIKTDSFTLIADKGAIDIWGKIDASGDDQGGTIEIYAQKDLTLESTGQILANSSGANGEGGQVFLSSADGGIATYALPPEYGPSSSLIDVTGAEKNGTVTFRANVASILVKNADGTYHVNPDGTYTNADKIHLNGEIRGDATPTMQAYEIFQDSTVTDSDVADYFNSINQVLPHLQASWLQASTQHADITLVPEIIIESQSDMTIGEPDQQINLSNYRFYSQADIDSNAESPSLPGVLTFRAKGNLFVESDIVDSPSVLLDYMTVKSPEANNRIDSWGLNFVAGADLGSANYMAVNKGIGNFSISNNTQVFTESAAIRFASGKDTLIGNAKSGSSEYNGYIGYMAGTNFYTLATFDGTIRGSVGGDLDMDVEGSAQAGAGVIETGIGDIHLNVDGNVILGNEYGTPNDDTEHGAIRTVGRMPTEEEMPSWYKTLRELGFGDEDLNPLRQASYWAYQDGGNITLSAGGDITGYVNKSGAGWDTVATDLTFDFDEENRLIKIQNGQWSAEYEYGISDDNTIIQATQGVAALANGNVTIKSGGDFNGQAGTFGTGDLTITTFGKMDGRFINMDGRAHLTALEDFGKQMAVIDLGNSDFSINSLANIYIDSARNPAFVQGEYQYKKSELTPDGEEVLLEESSYNILSYTDQTSLTLQTAKGDVSVYGKVRLDEKDKGYFKDNDNRSRLLPATLGIIAGRDIILNDQFDMAPASKGNLTMLAGRDIDGQDTVHKLFSSIVVSDMDPAQVYGRQDSVNIPLGTFEQADQAHSLDILHEDDDTPIEIKAGNNIQYLHLHLPKKAVIIAGGDIREIEYKGQNIKDTDMSMVSAAGSIDLNLSPGFTDSLGIEQAGPGYLLVQAGNSIDLGRSDGISTVGDMYNKALVALDSEGNPKTELNLDSEGNPILDSEGKPIVHGYDFSGSDLTVIAGYDIKPGKEAIEDFFAKLQEMGKEYSQLKDTKGKDKEQIFKDKQAALDLKEKLITETIQPFLPESIEEEPGNEEEKLGNIRLVDSRIKTAGKNDIHIISANQLDVGTAVLKAEGSANTDTGIMTEGGGNINIYTKNDINVNESRVVSYFGGDILLMSKQGDINAGRGSTTSVSLQPKGTMLEYGRLIPQFSAPGVGSGVRILTYDRDGDLELKAPELGAASLVALNGIIDAGEAGISAGQLILAANEVRNSQNISFSGSGVGVPVSTDAGPNLGALAGASIGSNTASEFKQATDSMGQLDNTGKELAEAIAKSVENLNLKLLVFKVVDFSDEMSEDSNKSTL